MLYLASQFAWFLLAAFALGLIMGWISHAGSKSETGRGVLVGAAGVWALGASLTWTQTLNGVAALWIESALLFGAVYCVGCVLGATMRAGLGPQTLADAGAEAAHVMPRAVSHEPGRVDPPIGQDKPVAADPEAASEAAKAPVEGDEAEKRLEGEAALPGRRPEGLDAARAGLPDDLKLIKGVGHQNEARLHGLGIWHFDQIAAWEPPNVEWVGGYLAFPGRIEREDWVGQAKALARGERSDFARRAEAGEVASSRDDGAHGQSSVAALSDGVFEGERPGNLLEAARDGKPDDLALIKGIGPGIAADLNRLGIWHFDQIAVLKELEIRYLRAFAKAPGHSGENWREDADILANGGDTAHSRAIKAGRRKPES